MESGHLILVVAFYSFFLHTIDSAHNLYVLFAFCGLREGLCSFFAFRCVADIILRLLLHRKIKSLSI
jgi:hypothetical protein